MTMPRELNERSDKSLPLTLIIIVDNNRVLLASGVTLATQSLLSVKLRLRLSQAGFSGITYYRSVLDCRAHWVTELGWC
eukprot:g59353.t1